MLGEDQVNYLRSLGIQAAFIGKRKTKDQEMLNGQGAFSLFYRSPESLTGDKKFRATFSKEFYQKNTVAVVMTYVGKYTDLFTRKSATLKSLWGILKVEWNVFALGFKSPAAVFNTENGKNGNYGLNSFNGIDIPLQDPH